MTSRKDVTPRLPLGRPELRVTRASFLAHQLAYALLAYLILLPADSTPTVSSPARWIGTAGLLVDISSLLANGRGGACG